MHPQTRSLYEALIAEGPAPDRMLVLSDALEEFDDDVVTATAYRHAAEKGLWPFERIGQFSCDKLPKVWDWDCEERHKRLPIHCKLPPQLFNAICRISGRIYGDVHQAFVLLGIALEMSGFLKVTKESK